MKTRYGSSEDSMFRSRLDMADTQSFLCTKDKVWMSCSEKKMWASIFQEGIQKENKSNNSLRDLFTIWDFLHQVN